MKNLFLVVISILLFFSICFSQDYSSYYLISGFTLPVLHEGQYSLSFSPGYSYQPSYQTGSEFSNNTFQNISFGNQKYSMFSFGLSGLYGISDKTTLSLSFTVGPRQSSPTGSNTNLYRAESGWTKYVNDESGYTDQVGATFIIAHRITHNIEFSATTDYSVNNMPNIQTNTQSNTNNPSSQSIYQTAYSYKYRYLNIVLNITLLSN